MSDSVVQLRLTYVTNDATIGVLIMLDIIFWSFVALCTRLTLDGIFIGLILSDQTFKANIAALNGHGNKAVP